MNCAWQAYLNLLPISLRSIVDKLGREGLQELRLRLGQKAELILKSGAVISDQYISYEELQYCLNMASGYSPWSASTIRSGFITAPGGHRIGVCGEVSTYNGKMNGVRYPGMICIRVARDFPGIAAPLKDITGSVLIIGKPGCGKTTLLRDLIRQKSTLVNGDICVIDERQEIFPRINNGYCFDPGMRTDILSGCSKREGIINAIRCMNPSWIAVDEITATEDCQAFTYAGWCGIDLIATAHAGSKDDLFTRPIYSEIIKSGLIKNLIILNKDQSWIVERM